MSLVVFAALALPIILVIYRWRFGDTRGNSSAMVDGFLRNKGRNGLVATLAGAICGNVGIGTFLAIFIFAQASPVIGFSIAGAYTLGLVLCAVFAKHIHRAGRAHNTAGIIDLIWKTHGAPPLRFIWVPVAFVFVLRSCVQLAALGLLIAQAFDISQVIALVLGASVLTGYLVIGGYRASVETDIVQAVIILIMLGFVAAGVVPDHAPTNVFFDLGPYQPALLIGIWLLLPFSAILAVDNWQRITVVENARTARLAYGVAAPLLCAVYGLIALVGYRAVSGTDMYTNFANLMPGQAVWMASILFVTSIMSSIDTFVMPLVTPLGAKLKSIRGIRIYIVLIMVVTTLTALMFADFLTNIIAAFNSLTVFLPAAFGALFLKNPPPRAAILSMNIGLLASLVLTFVNINAAAVVGFLVAGIIYAMLVFADRRSA